MKCLRLACRFLIVSKCEAISPALDVEYKAEVKAEESGVSSKPNQAMDVDEDVKIESPGIVLKPKQEFKTKSAAQIFHDQHGK